MFEYWQTYLALRKARHLERRMDAVSYQASLPLRPAALHAGQQIKQLFLTALASGKTHKIAPHYGKRLSQESAPSDDQKPQVPLDSALACLQALQSIFTRTKARPFLVSGTFLGSVREQRILAHDYDLDFGIDLTDEFAPDLFAALKQHPAFEVQHEQFITNEVAMLNPWAKDHAGQPWLIKLCYQKVIPIDFFIHVSHEGESFHGSRRNLWVNSTFELAPQSLYGLEFLAPKDAETYLTENYGDWRTPVRQFDCTTDTPNARLLDSTTALRFLIKRYLTVGQRGDTRRQAIFLKRIQESFCD